MALFDIGVSEILATLGPFEKRQIYDELSEKFDETDGPRLEGKGLTPTEADFRSILCDIWERRNVLTPGQMNTIANILTEPFIQ